MTAPLSSNPYLRAMQVHRAFLVEFRDLAASALSPEAMLGVQFLEQAALRHIDSQIALLEAATTEVRQ